MNKKEYLLTVLAEECAETAQRASKAIRFTPEEVQPGQDLTNAERLVYEFNDILAVMYLLKESGVINRIIDPEMIDKKRMKIKEFMQYSKERGTLE